MTIYFQKDEHLLVSHYDDFGWWITNETIMVHKGTGLPRNCTNIVYVPSVFSKIARFVNGSWLNEVTDNRKLTFFDKYGNITRIKKPDADVSDLTVIPPPLHNKKVQSVLFDANTKTWSLYDNHVGREYYAHDGSKHIVTSRYFKLPDNHTFKEKPKHNEKWDFKLENDNWIRIESTFNRKMYPKDKKGKIIQGGFGKECPDTHTLVSPELYDVWDTTLNTWVKDFNAERDDRLISENAWIREQLEEINKKLLDVLVCSRFNKKTIISDNDVDDLLKYRDEILKHESSNGFPFSKRPVTPNVLINVGDQCSPTQDS